MKSLAFAMLALAGAGLATEASAQCAVGVQAGYAMANMGLASPVLGGLGIDGLGAKSTSPDYGARVGCDLRIPSTPFKAGVFGEIQQAHTEFAIQPALLTVALGRSWMVGGRLAYDMGAASPYVLLGRKVTEVEYGGIATAIPGFAGIGLPTKLTGWTWGGGIEVPIKATPILLTLEVRNTRYNEESIAGGLATVKTDHTEALLRVDWQFLK